MMNRLSKKILRKVTSIIDNCYFKNGIGYPYRGYEALQYLLEHFDFDSVLDVGCGQGIHSDIFLKAGKSVIGIDYGESYYFKKMDKNPAFLCIVGDFLTHDFDKKYDCIWCSHVLEHQLNPHDFLVKTVSLLSEGGVSNYSSSL